MRRGLGALGEGREEEARRGGRARSVERQAPVPVPAPSGRRVRREERAQHLTQRTSVLWNAPVHPGLGRVDRARALFYGVLVKCTSEHKGA